MLGPSSGLHVQDLAAALVAVILTCGMVYLSAAGLEVPGAYASAEGSAIAWLFIRSVQVGGNGRA